MWFLGLCSSREVSCLMKFGLLLLFIIFKLFGYLSKDWGNLRWWEFFFFCFLWFGFFCCFCDFSFVNVVYYVLLGVCNGCLVVCFGCLFCVLWFLGRWLDCWLLLVWCCKEMIICWLYSFCCDICYWVFVFFWCWLFWWWFCCYWLVLFVFSVWNWIVRVSLFGYRYIVLIG